MVVCACGKGRVVWGSGAVDEGRGGGVPEDTTGWGGVGWWQERRRDGGNSRRTSSPKARPGGFKTHQGMATCAATPVLVRAVQPL